MARMDDTELKAIVQSEIEQSLNYYDSEFSGDRITAMERYLGEPFGNEQTGRSQVVDTVVSDCIEMAMPSLMRVFTSTKDVVRFLPRTAEDVPKAEQAQDYVNFILNSDNNWFQLAHNWFKDSLLLRMGILKHGWNSSIETTEENYEGLTEDELTLMLSSEEVELVEQDARPAGEPVQGPDGQIIPAPIVYDVKVKRSDEQGRVVIENIPPEEFLVSHRAKSIDDADFVCHRSAMTVSDLVAMGYDRDLVEEHAGTDDLDNSSEVQNRFRDIESGSADDSGDPTRREVMVNECYIRVDYDGDDVSELRRILTIGDTSEILENEPYDYIPFSVLSPILMPHRLVGRSFADLVLDLQLIRSTVLRQLLDNLYLTNNARVVAVEGQTNLDDVMNSRPGGIIRVRQPGMVQPLAIPQVGNDALRTLQYLDELKENRTGMSKASMGLDADALQSTSAVAISAQMTASQAKLEMMARIFAETGVRHLMHCVLRLVTMYQNKPRIIRLRNKFVAIDPREWDTEFDLEVSVGLGTGNEDQKMGMLAQIASKQEQILQTLGANNGVVTLAQYVSTLRRMAEMSGFKDVDSFFSMPQGDPQPQQGADPEMQVEMQKIQQEMEMKKYEIDQKMVLEREKLAMEMQLKQQELGIETELEAARMAAGDPAGNANIPRIV